MSTTIKDLGNGQFLVNTGTAAYVTDQDQLAEDTRQTESEIERQHQRVADWNADETCIQSHIDQITAGTLTPEPGTSPEQYLCECPANNYFVATKAQLEQRIATQQSNQSYVTVTHIPELEAELADMNDALDQIATEPTGDSEVLTAAGLPTDVPSHPADDLVINLNSAMQGEVKYVKAKVTIDHPSPPGEIIHINLHHNGEHRELYQGDMGTDEQKELETAYFNGMDMSGGWDLHLINDHTASVNVIKNYELTLIY